MYNDQFVDGLQTFFSNNGDFFFRLMMVMSLK